MTGQSSTPGAPLAAPQFLMLAVAQGVRLAQLLDMVSSPTPRTPDSVIWVARFCRKCSLELFGPQVPCSKPAGQRVRTMAADISIVCANCQPRDVPDSLRAASDLSTSWETFSGHSGVPTSPVELPSWRIAPGQERGHKV